jgi:hypothetical protein
MQCEAFLSLRALASLLVVALLGHGHIFRFVDF